MGTHEPPGCPRSTLRDTVARTLGHRPGSHPGIDVQAPTVMRGREWSRSGTDGVELSWGSPATQAWLLRPAGHTGPDLPAVLLLHGHDGVKFYGKEKVADGPDGIAPGIAELRAHGYDSRAVAEELVGAGFAVLVHDVFPWGSRRVDWQDFPARAQRAGLAFESESERYEAAAREHEHGLAKAAILRNMSLAGMILSEDLLALAVLRAAAGIDPNRIAIAGFSGGGARVVHLLACAELQAAAVTAMMSTFADIANGHADDTTWAMITPGLPAVCDWPDVASASAPMPLLVQFAEYDSHFGVHGMREAERSLEGAYAGSGALTTQWYADRHRFSAAMQSAVARWLVRNV